MTCQLPADIDPGATETVDFSTTFSPGLDANVVVTNTATVQNQATNPDPNLANNTSSATTTVNADADVAVGGLTVTPTDPSSTGPGSDRAVHFTITNNGPSTAKNVTFRVQRGADATVDPSTLPTNCTYGPREIVCTIDGADLAPGQSVDIDYTITLAGYDAPGTYTKTVHVASSTPDSDLTNNDTSAPTIITAAVTQLQVTKTALNTITAGDGHQAYVAGEPFTYQVTVAVPSTRGDGLADASIVQFRDALPPGFDITAASTTQGTCVFSPAVVTCPLGTVTAWPNAKPAIITIHGVVSSTAAGEQIGNTATARSSTLAADGTRATASGSVAVDVVDRADLKLFKTADAPTAPVGGSVGFTLTTVNAGPSDVSDAVITDTLPAGLDLDPANSPGCTVTNGDANSGETVTCAVGAIAVGDSTAIRLVATTSSVAPASTITNTARVSASAQDPAPGNNDASVTVDLRRLADVAISASVSTTTPAAGGDITYTGYTINNGPSAAWHTTGDTTFPPGFVPVSAEVPFNTCTWSPAAPAEPASVAWKDVSYTLHCEPSVASAPFEPGIAGTSVVVMHIPGDTPAGAYRATTRVATDTAESTYDNNSASLTVQVGHVSDLDVVKTLVAPNPMVTGQPATWRLTVTNAGPSSAENVVISDAVPPGFTFASATNAAGEACPAPDVVDTETIVRCPMGTLPVGASASATVRFNVATSSADELCNSALVGSGSLDPDAHDNETRSCGRVVGPPPRPATDVGTTITASRTRVRPGASVSFRAVVRNNGPDAATDVVIRIPVPTGLRNLSGVLLTSSDGTHPAATCKLTSPRRAVTGRAAATLVCTVGRLAPGQQATYRLTGRATGAPGSRITLVDIASHGETDTDHSNDSDRAVVHIRRHPNKPGPSASGPHPPGTPGSNIGGPGGPAGPGGPGEAAPGGPGPGGTGAPEAGYPGTPANASGGLPGTGGPARWWILGGIGLVLVGAVMMLGARPRRRR